MDCVPAEIRTQNLQMDAFSTELWYGIVGLLMNSKGFGRKSSLQYPEGTEENHKKKTSVKITSNSAEI